MRLLFNTALTLFYGLLGMMAGAIVIILAAYLYLGPKLPSVETLKDVQLQTPLRIYSADGALMGEFGEKRRSPINYSSVPPLFIKAILAAEDDRFLQHHGVDLRGLLRAVSQLITTGQIQTGGSTITMQVARNFFLSREKTFFRKFNEIFLALQIERQLSKDEILELYINKIYLGHRAYGIEAAAQVYYGTSIDQLSLAQLAMIAGLPKAPSSYNPITNPSRALLRRNWILNRMQQLGYIDQLQHQEASLTPNTAFYHGLSIDLDAPYVAEMVRQELLALYGKSAYTDGYQVYTTIDSKLQRKAQDAVVRGLMAYDKRHGYRGPESHVSASNQWTEHLQTAPVFPNLLPAIVSTTNETEITALLADGSTISLPWQNNLNQIRRYIDEDRLSSKPQNVMNIAKVGDQIRVSQTEAGEWQLSQIPKAQAALVSLAPKDGAIYALTGGFDYYHSKFNRATQAERQPGSNFKPMIYAAALEHGFTAASLINDAPVVFNDARLEDTWRPANDSGKFYGPTPLRVALYKSRNLVSIRLLRELGIDNAINYVSRFGIAKSKLPHDLSLALGSYALSPLAVATAYASFANGGYRVEPYLISHILDAEGNLLFEAQPLTVCEECEENENRNTDSIMKTGNTETEPDNMEDVLASGQTAQKPVAPRIIEKRVAYIMDNVLKDVIKKGTGRGALTLKREDIAGKTGTTNGPTDAWFSGYQPTIVTTTWLGFDNNRKIGRHEFGGTAALPIWIDYMRVALRDRQEQILKQPDGIVSVLIDPKTGQRAKPGQKDAVFEIFRSEYAPKPETGATDTMNTNAEPLQPAELF